MEPGAEVIADRRNVRTGSNGLYDIRLLRREQDSLLIEVALSFFFEFIPNTADSRVVWTAEEQAAFVGQWLAQIPATWNRQNHIAYRGFNVSIAFVATVRAQAENTQWHARVMKLPTRTTIHQSAVCRGCYPNNADANLDSNEDVPNARRKTGIIHEFGHMIGLADEYTSGSAHREDKDSVMNNGARVRNRHFLNLENWAKPHIDRLAEEQLRAVAFAPKTILITGYTRVIGADTIETEIAAAEAWRDGSDPEQDVQFVVRRRDTHAEIPLDQIPLDNVASIEVAFFPPEEKGKMRIWEPKSREALEVFLQGV